MESISAARREIAILVRDYWMIQRRRVAIGNQIRTVGSTSSIGDVLRKLHQFHLEMERSIASSLEDWVKTTASGRWCLGNVGVGPVIAAALLSLIDPAQCVTAGKVWRYAGLDPSIRWMKGARRPFNTEMKYVCYLLGESLARHGDREGCLYGQLYKIRRQTEWERNVRGDFAQQALRLAETRPRGSKEWKWNAGCYSGADFSGRVVRGVPAKGPGIPMLTPGHIRRRALRWAVKVFLAHFAQVYYEDCFGIPHPRPLRIRVGKIELDGAPGWRSPEPQRVRSLETTSRSREAERELF